jgi:hypothetical protein
MKHEPRRAVLETGVHDEPGAELVFPLVELATVRRAEARPVRLHADVRFHDARVLEGPEVGGLRVVLQAAEGTFSSPGIRVVDPADLQLPHGFPAFLPALPVDDLLETETSPGNGGRVCRVPQRHELDNPYPRRYPEDPAHELLVE